MMMRRSRTVFAATLAVVHTLLVGLGSSQAGGAAFGTPVTADAVEFNPAFAPAPPAQTSGGRRSQSGETWDGTAPLPDPLGVTGSADIHQFQVLSGFDNDSMTVTISWNAGAQLGYDLDLYVERLDAFGNWVEVGRSTDGQLLGDGEAVEAADVKSPPPGTYRARVVNFASTELAYSGSIGFAVVKGGAKPSVAERRSTGPTQLSGLS
jgi:hypothetical protein